MQKKGTGLKNTPPPVAVVVTNVTCVYTTWWTTNNQTLYQTYIVWPYGPTIKQNAVLIFYGVSININSIINKKLLIRENRRTQWRKKYYALKVGKFKFNERPLQQFCKNIFAFCIFWYFMLLRQRKEYWLSFSEGDNIQYIHLGRNMNFSWDRGFYKVGSKLQNRAFQDPPSQNRSCPKKTPWNQPINPSLNFHNSKEWLLQSFS